MIRCYGLAPEHAARKPAEDRRVRESAIEGNAFGGLIRDPGLSLRLLTILVVFLLVGGCGGDGEQAQQPPPAPPGGATENTQGGGPPAPPGGNTAGGATVRGNAQAETLDDQPFTLNQRQPVPQDFRNAYQRKALIVVEFFQEGEDPFYPQGLEVDDLVNSDLRDLRNDYPEIEFFTYDITEPGDAETSEDLSRGEYGTLAAQLEVGFTPFIAMLAPREEEYVIENLFQGYVEQGVLDQALFDLSRTDVGGNSSDVAVDLEGLELTETGGGIEYITIANQGDEEIDLSGFTLSVQDPETGEIDGGGNGVEINELTRIGPRQVASIGRAPDVVDAEGRLVIGTFTNGASLTVQPGDQVALLDNGGAVVDTITV